ncbi:hypothetical protein FXO38_31609 [Capsicum annuum]|nr:hypothetical protein FXO38_31609 [Capsicum annuum]
MVYQKIKKNTLTFEAKAWWTLAQHRLYPTTGDNVLILIWAVMIASLIARHKFNIEEFVAREIKDRAIGDVAKTIDTDEMEAQDKMAHTTNAVGTSSALLLVQSVPPRPRGSGQTLDIADIKVEFAKIKWMVSELNDRSMILKLMVETVVPTVNVDNIWDILDLIAVLVVEIREEKKDRKRKRHELRRLKRKPKKTDMCS